MKKLFMLFLIPIFFACSVSIGDGVIDEIEDVINNDDISSDEAVFYQKTANFVYSKISEEGLDSLDGQIESIKACTDDPFSLGYQDLVVSTLDDKFTIYLFEVLGYLVPEPSSLSDLELGKSCYVQFTVEDDQVDLGGEYGVYSLTLSSNNLYLDADGAYPDNRFYKTSGTFAGNYTFFENTEITSLVNGASGCNFDEVGNCAHDGTCSIVGYIKIHMEGTFDLFLVDDVNDPTVFCSVDGLEFDTPFVWDSATYLGAYDSTEKEIIISGIE